MRTERSMGRASRRVGAMALAVSAILAAPVARADHPANPARPTTTEGAYALEEGSLQMELGYRLVNTDADLLSHYVPLLLRLGAADFVDVRLGATVFKHSMGDNGFGDLSLGARFVTNDEDTYLPAFGLLAQVTAPTATGPFSGAHVGFDTGLEVSKRFFEFVQLDLYGGLRADLDAGRGRGDTWAIPGALAVHFDIYGIIDLFGEFSAIAWVDGGPETLTASGLVGFGWRVAPEVVIDLAAEMGATRLADDVTATIGFTWNVADFW